VTRNARGSDEILFLHFGRNSTCSNGLEVRMQREEGDAEESVLNEESEIGRQT
jgi:hypothetical protein